MTQRKFIHIGTIIITILVIVFISLSYLKTSFLYRPSHGVLTKYNRFYQKLLSQLVESEEQISTYLVESTYNVVLDLWYISNPNSDKCIIFFHGNSGNLAMRFDMIKFLYNYASVAIFDYRSYGRSSGSKYLLTSSDLFADGKNIWLFITQNLKIDPRNVSLFGESLGCSIAIRLAAELSINMDDRYYPHSLILNAPFYSLQAMIQNTFEKVNIGFLGTIISLFFGREYKSNEWIQYVNHQTKIIIAHSTRDEIIPYKQGVNLYNSISQTHPHTQFITITGTHNSVGLTDAYIYALADIFYD